MPASSSSPCSASTLAGLGDRCAILGRSPRSPAIGHRVHSPDLRDLGGLRELCSHDLGIVWHKDTMELARTSPSQSPRPLDPADRVRRSLRTPFELRACSKPDRLGLRPRSSELRSLPLDLRSSSMMCARRSPAEQDIGTQLPCDQRDRNFRQRIGQSDLRDASIGMFLNFPSLRPGTPCSGRFRQCI